MSKPTFSLHLVGYDLHPPEAFRPDSDIGAAYRRFVEATAAAQAADADLAGAQQELRELKQFVANAGPLTNRKRFGEARDSIELLGRSIPQLEAANAKAQQALAAATQGHNSYYHGYANNVRQYNDMLTGGLNWAGGSSYRYSEWAAQLQQLPRWIAEAEAQLIGAE